MPFVLRIIPPRLSFTGCATNTPKRTGASVCSTRKTAAWRTPGTPARPWQKGNTSPTSTAMTGWRRICWSSCWSRRGGPVPTWSYAIWSKPKRRTCGFHQGPPPRRCCSAAPGRWKRCCIRPGLTPVRAASCSVRNFAKRSFFPRAGFMRTCSRSTKCCLPRSGWSICRGCSMRIETTPTAS